MDKSNYKALLFNIARIEANKHRFHFSQDSQNEIRNLISIGVENMTPADLGNESRRRIAEEHIRKFVIHMVENADNRNIKYLDSRAFMFVRFKFCPLWPFC